MGVGKDQRSIDPQFIASVTMPAYFDRPTEFSFFAGSGVEFARELGLDGYRLFFAPQIGFLLGNGERVEGVFAPLPFVIGVNAGLRFGPITKRR
jgi:hypothetical protein